MKKNIKRLASFVFSLAMMASMLYAFHPCHVQAAESSNPIYTLNVNYSCTYDEEALKYNGDPIDVAPDFSVGFHLDKGDAAPAIDNNYYSLKEGIMQGIEKTDYAVSFKSYDDYLKNHLDEFRKKENKKWSDISEHVNTSDKIKITKKVLIDFSKVNFPGPGIYNYVLSVKKLSGSESAFNEAVFEDHFDKINIFVYVMQNDDGTLSVNAFDGGDGTTNYGLYKDNDVNKTGSIGFYYGGTGFSLDKGVAGNMGDKSEYFTFDVHLKNLDSNAIYHINTKTDVNHNDEYFISDSSGKADVKVKLKNGDKMLFTYLPKGTIYTISEEKTGGYDTLIGSNGDDPDPFGVKHDYSAADVVDGKGYDWNDYDSSNSKKDVNYGYFSRSWKDVKKIKMSQKEETFEIYNSDTTEKYTGTVTKYIVGSYNENNEITGSTNDIYACGINKSVHYINVRNGVLPTGIVLNNLPAIFGILSIALMAVIIFLTRKKPNKKQ